MYDMLCRALDVCVRVLCRREKTDTKRNEARGVARCDTRCARDRRVSSVHRPRDPLPMMSTTGSLRDNETELRHVDCREIVTWC